MFGFNFYAYPGVHFASFIVQDTSYMFVTGPEVVKVRGADTSTGSYHLLVYCTVDLII